MAGEATSILPHSTKQTNMTMHGKTRWSDGGESVYYEGNKGEYDLDKEKPRE